MEREREPKQQTQTISEKEPDRHEAKSWLSTDRKVHSRGKFTPKEIGIFHSETALKIAQNTEKYLGIKKDTPSKYSAVSTYRLKLAEISKRTNQKNLAQHYNKQTPSAMECDRLIRNFMRQRGVSTRDTNQAMRRASPALYRKSQEDV